MHNTGFQITPDTHSLEQMERLFAFHPANPETACTLTSDQIESFNRDGYVRPLRVFSDEEIATQRQWFDQLLADITAAGGDSYSISTAHLKYGPVYDLITHPKIVAAVVDLLGENVVGWGSHYFCKMPGDGKSVAWHQDASYWPLSPSHAVTVWLAIDDADRENACMKFLAGSHHRGHIEYRRSDSTEGNVLDQTVEDVSGYGEEVFDELRAGEISIHSDLLLHGSEANTSDRRRCGLTLRYCTVDVRAGMDWNKKGVIVSGADPSGHWANPARPE